MTLSRRVHELRSAVGSPSQVVRKLRGAARTTVLLLSRAEREARIARLQATGMMGERPTDWQMVLGAHHMLLGYLLPSNLEFYEHYEQSHHWQQLLRVLDEPSAMMDPIGLGIDRDELVSHLIQVVHASAGYDVALLMMFEDGVSELRVQLEQVVAGTHPRQAALQAILERADYPAALLAALDRFEADPVTNWRVATVPAPEGCDRLFDWGIDTFGTPGRFMAYCRTLPPTPTASLRAWFAGDLRIPSPA